MTSHVKPRTWWRRLWTYLFVWRPDGPLLQSATSPSEAAAVAGTPAAPALEPRPVWRALGASVQGAQHRRHGLPNQDALFWLPETGMGPPLVVAVADGHGSPRCFRSQIGARLAVETAARLLLEFVQSWRDAGNLSQVKRAAEDSLPRKITDAWGEAVQSELAAQPFTEDELECSTAAVGPSGRARVESCPITAYGSTVLTAVVTQEYLLLLQQGDGDLLLVDAEGGVTRPLPRDERLIANETTSLSHRDDVCSFRVGFQVVSAAAPAPVLLSTDGYSNSFQTDRGFLKVGSDLLDQLRSDGLARVAEQLPGWLAETTEVGGDDITVGMLCRMDALVKSPGVDNSNSVRPVAVEELSSESHSGEKPS